MTRTNQVQCRLPRRDLSNVARLAAPRRVAAAAKSRRQVDGKYVVRRLCAIAKSWRTCAWRTSGVLCCQRPADEQRQENHDFSPCESRWHRHTLAPRVRRAPKGWQLRQILFLLGPRVPVISPGHGSPPPWRYPLAGDVRCQRHGTGRAQPGALKWRMAL